VWPDRRRLQPLPGGGFVNVPMGETLAARLTAPSRLRIPSSRTPTGNPQVSRTPTSSTSAGSCCGPPRPLFDVNLTIFIGRTNANGNADYAYKVLAFR